MPLLENRSSGFAGGRFLKPDLTVSIHLNFAGALSKRDPDQLAVAAGLKEPFLAIGVDRYLALFEGGVGHPRSRGILEFHAGHASGKLTILDRGTAFFADTDTFVSTVLDTAVLHFQITLHNIQTVVAGVLEQAVDHATFAAVEVQGVHRCVHEWRYCLECPQSFLQQAP